MITKEQLGIVEIRFGFANKVISVNTIFRKDFYLTML